MHNRLHFLMSSLCGRISKAWVSGLEVPSISNIFYYPRRPADTSKCCLFLAKQLEGDQTVIV